MSILAFFSLLFFPALVLSSVSTPPFQPSNSEETPSIDLSELEVIYLSQDRFTASRRAEPIPQLNCVSGCYFGFIPSIATCYNLGWNGIDFTWSCESNMPAGFSFAEVTVSCEGVSGPGDRVVLLGSCGLYYSLNYYVQGSDYDSAYQDADLYDDETGADSYEYVNPHLSGAFPTGHPGAIHLSDVSFLQFTAGRFTQTYRTEPLPHLNCLGAYCNHSPSFIECHNVGWDALSQSFMWDCRSEMTDPNLVFGEIQVECEGVSGEGDLNVVLNSCALFFSLDYVNSYEDDRYF